jgi:hypothetical protein
MLAWPWPEARPHTPSQKRRGPRGWTRCGGVNRHHLGSNEEGDANGDGVADEGMPVPSDAVTDVLSHRGDEERNLSPQMHRRMVTGSAL